VSVNGSDLLSRLGGGVATHGLNATRQPTKTTASPGGADFAAMLEKARTGGVQSGSPVQIEAGLDLALSPAEKAALERAADQAEAQGAERALVLLDSRALLLDVTARQIVDAPDLGSGSVLAQVDAVIRADSDGREEDAPPAGPTGVGNLSLLDALNKLDERRNDRAAS